ncbi:glycoside hydrolase family 140 protein [candidate division KSB1 bacterium]|nr:glycoside hydrolase family 140 protein [candidate division KSB1 bacterium]
MKLMLFILLTSLLGLASAQAPRLPLLKISDDQRYLVTENNQPFLWLGDTAWELLHRLDRDETMIYLKDRAAKGFTVIQTVILAELDGLNTPNANGDLPLIDKDPTKLNAAYFAHVDWVVGQAEKLGLYLGLLPTWGDKFNQKWGVGPEIFTPENAAIYGELLAKRYLNQNNIIWILGGDRLAETDIQRQIVEVMARGIRKIDTKHLITYHPWGGEKATNVFNEKWLDLDLFQTGHDRRVKDFEFVRQSRAVSPPRPVINGEPRYENHPNRFDPKNFGWMDDSDVRAAAYWTILSGAAGYTYGCHDIWQMFDIHREPINGARTRWQESIHLPGSKQLGFIKALLTAFPWQEMTNDQSFILNENPEDSSYVVSAVGKKKEFALAYIPMGKPITVDLSKINAQKVSALWFNPRDGKSKKIGEYAATETPEFKPWSIGRGSDFLLVIMDVQAAYQLPE